MKIVTANSHICVAEAKTKKAYTLKALKNRERDEIVGGEGYDALSLREKAKFIQMYKWNPKKRKFLLIPRAERRKIKDIMIELKKKSISMKKRLRSMRAKIMKGIAKRKAVMGDTKIAASATDTDDIDIDIKANIYMIKDFKLGSVHAGKVKTVKASSSNIDKSALPTLRDFLETKGFDFISIASLSFDDKSIVGIETDKGIILASDKYTNVDFPDVLRKKCVPLKSNNIDTKVLFNSLTK